MHTRDRRKINDDRLLRFGGQEPTRVIAFVCECGRRDCRRTVLLTSAEYLERRSGPILHDEHVTPPRDRLETG